MRRSDTELRALRDRFAGLDAAVALAEAEAEAEARCVLRAVTLQSEGSYPAAGGLFFSALPQVVTGPEKEGGTPTFAAETQPIYPYAPGSGAPAVGSRSVAALVPYRWALLRRGGPNTTFSGVFSGCAGHGIAGTVVIKRASDNVEVFRATVGDDGAYSGSLSLTANTAMTVTGTPAVATYWAANSVARTMNAGTANAGFNVAAAFAATNTYVCSQVCPNPFNITRVVNVADSTAGNYTLAWEGGLVNAFRSATLGADVRFQPQTSTFNFGQITTSLTSYTCGPPFTFVFTQTNGTRTFTVTQS